MRLLTPTNDKAIASPPTLLRTSLAAGPCTLVKPTALIDTEGLPLSNDTWGALERGRQGRRVATAQLQVPP